MTTQRRRKLSDASEPWNTTLRDAFAVLETDPSVHPAAKMLRGVGDTVRGVVGLACRLHALQQVVDCIRIGIITIDGDDRLLSVNKAARRFLEQRSGLTDQKGKLTCTHGESAPAFAAALARARGAGAPPAEPRQATLAIPRSSGRRPLAVMVTSLAPEEFRALDVDSITAPVLITLSDPDADLDLRADSVASLLGLTLTEARVAVAIVADIGLDEYAKQAGVTIGTARWTVKQAMEKLGCRRQSELVRLVATSVAGVVLDPPPRA